MWDKIVKRQHKPVKIFPFGQASGNTEIMIYGTVDYTLKTGDEVKDVPWSARANMTEKEGGKMKMAYYQVYLVRTCFLIPSHPGLCPFE